LRTVLHVATDVWRLVSRAVKIANAGSKRGAPTMRRGSCWWSCPRGSSGPASWRSFSRTHWVGITSDDWNGRR